MMTDDSIEVTQEMIEAGEQTFCAMVYGWDCISERDRKQAAQAIYRAMHAARPEAKHERTMQELANEGQAMGLYD
jgi:hypothetical protein